MQFSSKGKVYDIPKLQENLTKLITLRRNNDERKNQPSELVGKEIIHTWTIESGENRDWEGEIRSFENDVYKVIEYQILQVFDPNNEDFTLFHRINALTKHWHLITI